MNKPEKKPGELLGEAIGYVLAVAATALVVVGTGALIAIILRAVF